MYHSNINTNMTGQPYLISQTENWNVQNHCLYTWSSSKKIIKKCICPVCIEV